MFKSGTVLKLKEPRGPEPKIDPYTDQPVMKKTRNPRTGEEKFTDEPVMLPFPYNEVEVIGPSPVVHSDPNSPWQGGDAVGVIIRPLSDFAGNLDEPLGKLKQLYDVVSIPEAIETPIERTIKVIDATTNQAGETPEEVFAREAPGVAPKAGQKRGRTKPFDDVTPPKGTKGQSPL